MVDIEIVSLVYDELHQSILARTAPLCHLMKQYRCVVIVVVVVVVVVAAAAAAAMRLELVELRWILTSYLVGSSGDFVT